MGGERGLEREVLEDRNPPGDLADLAGGTAVHLGHLAQRSPQSKAVVVRHHGRLGPGIPLEDVRQHPVALVPGKIEVDVGRVLPLGVEEALEQEPRTERLDVGDPEAVAHDRVGDRAPAAVGGAVAHDVLHHQEVVGESLLPDDGELVLDPVAGDRRDGAVAPLRALVGLGAEPREGVGDVGGPRGDDPAGGDPPGAALGQPLGGGDRLGKVGEMAGEVGGGAEPGVPRLRPRVLLDLRERRVQMNRAHQPLARPVLRMRHDHGVGGDRVEAEPTGGGQHGVALLARHQLGVDIGGAAPGHDPLEEGDVAGEEKQAGPVGGEVSGEPILSAPVDPGNRPAERAPAPLVGGQRDGLLGVGDQMRTEDGPHADGVAGALELEDAVDPVGVGAGQRPVPPLRGGGGEDFRARDADTEGEMGVEMEVDHEAPAPVSVFLRSPPNLLPGVGSIKQAPHPGRLPCRARQGNRLSGRAPMSLCQLKFLLFNGLLELNSVAFSGPHPRPCSLRQGDRPRPEGP
jgi:hypothetical protein